MSLTKNVKAVLKEVDWLISGLFMDDVLWVERDMEREEKKRGYPFSVSPHRDLVTHYNPQMEAVGPRGELLEVCDSFSGVVQHGTGRNDGTFTRYELEMGQVKNVQHVRWMGAEPGYGQSDYLDLTTGKLIK